MNSIMWWNFVKISLKLWPVGDWQTDKQTDRQNNAVTNQYAWKTLWLVQVTDKQDEDVVQTTILPKSIKTNLTSKIIGAWIKWPNMQILFKFQASRMKIDLLAKVDL